MKKRHLIVGTMLAALILGSTALLFRGNVLDEVVASSLTDMDFVDVESGEELDKDNMIFDDFSNGFNTNRWVVSKKAWGNKVPCNSGVIPENVMYNSVDKTMVFRALGDYYKDNDVNYDLDDRYGCGTSNGNVYSDDGTRTGGCIKTRELFGPGRFEARFKVAPVEGVCSAFWTFNYGDSGNANYNEMDFELPTYLYDTEEDRNDLYFNRIICTTYKTEGTYKSQRVTNPVYLNDNEWHTYCLDWYYSNNTKKVNWFIDGELICSCTSSKYISNNAGRVTLGAWIPGRESFCGIPNFDKAYMELDYFKYTPFKNQTYEPTGNSLGDYVTTYTTITETPENDFYVQGEFNHGLTENFMHSGDVVASKSYNYGGGNSSYGIKLAGNGGTGTSNIQWRQPNIRGINKLNLNFQYKGTGFIEAYADGEYFWENYSLSGNTWNSFSKNINIPSGTKVLAIIIYCQDNTNGLLLDNIHLNYPHGSDPVPSGLTNYSFFAKTNGQTTDSSSIERDLAPDGDSNHLWKVSAGKYYIKNNDCNTIYAKPTSTVMDADSSSYYYPFKTCLLNNGFTSSDKVALFAMQFDIDDFKDVEVAFYSYSGVSGRTVYLLYSLDSGSSWSILNSKACSEMSGDGSIFRYNYRYVAPNSLRGETLRLAVVGTLGASDDGYRIQSVFINNYNDFKARLDGSTCFLNSDEQALLAHEYANLTSNELTLLETEMMAITGQTYAVGYNYLLNYWNHQANGSRSFKLIKENAAIVAASFLIVSLSGLGLYFLIRRKKFNR